MSKWTPGPWKLVEREVLEDGSVYPRHIVGGERELQVCAVESMFVAEKISENSASFWKHSAQSEADARLIAAAPEMAELLERIVAAAADFVAEHKTAESPLITEARAILERINK